MNLKGLPKSGTTWQITALSRIQPYCKDKLTAEQKFNIPLCIPFHVGSYKRHPMELPHELTTCPRFIHQFKDNQTFYEELKRARFCTLTVFRDPRDRKVSYSHWNVHKRNLSGEVLYDIINEDDK